MSKRLCFFISLVLVLGLSGAAEAWKSIDDPNYNLSFEYDSNGDQMYCSTRVGCESEWDPNYVSHCGVMAWLENDVDWPVVEQDCSQSAGPSEDCQCKDSVFATEGICDLTMGQFGTITDANLLVWQSLDPTYNANVIIQPYYEYRLSYDTFLWGTPTLKAYLFYGNIADNNSLDADVNTVAEDEPSVSASWETYSLSFVAETGQPCIEEPLGIRFFQTGEGWYWIDNIRVEYRSLAQAHDPNPADEAEDAPMDVNLAWSPGLWAVNDVNGHEVYFGTSWADVNDANTTTVGIYRGTGVGVVSGPDGNNRYSYDVPETLELGKSYYWRIDEVNGSYVGPVPPVNDRWKGDVWSFEVTGLAYNVYPADRAEDIPALNLLLRWTAGTGAGGHDVYFGTSQADVEDANTANTGLYPGVYRGPTQPLSDVNYLVEPLGVSESYFWRIDEVNAVSTTFVEGDVWSFTTGVFLLVESFESYWYEDTADLRAVWKDWFANPTTQNKNDSQVKIYFAKTDANKVYTGEQSMEFAYRCEKKSGADYVGAEAEANLPLEVGTDWTVAGVKALVVHFYGDEDNAWDHNSGWTVIVDQMWVALEDGSTNVGVVRLPNLGDIKEESWHTWDISLQDPCFSAVDMNNVAKVYLGFGGQKVGQSAVGAGYKSGRHDTVWFDDIRLYPPRCMPSVTGIDVLHALGDFTEDCNTDYFDLKLMAQDWASIDGLANTENRPAVLTGYPDETSHWTTDCAVGTGAIVADEGYNIDVEDPRLFGLEYMSITAWVKQTISNSWVGVVSSRESYPGCGDDASELGIYGKAYGGPDGLGYDWSCGTEEWQWDAGLNVPTDGTWTFIALSVDPTGATLYMRPIGSALQTGARNPDAHAPQKNFANGFTIGNDDKSTRAHFVGKIDDVRIYGYNLSFDDVNNLAYQAAEPNPPPVYWYKFDEVTGYSAADSGTPIEVYTMNMSLANVVPKDPNDSEDPNLGTGTFDPNNMDIVNFLDYSIMAEHWLAGPFLWP